MSLELLDADARELQRLAELDRQRYVARVEQNERTQGTLRTAAFAGWLGLMVSAFQRDIAEAAGFAGAIALVFCVVDEYLEISTRNANLNIRILDELADSYRVLLGRESGNQDFADNFVADLEEYDADAARARMAVDWKDLLKDPPFGAFVYAYLVLALTGVCASVVLWNA